MARRGDRAEKHLRLGAEVDPTNEAGGHSEVEGHPGLPAKEPRRSRSAADEDRQCGGCGPVEEGGHPFASADLGGRTGQDGGLIAGNDGARGEQFQQASEVAGPGGGQKGVDDLTLRKLVLGGGSDDLGASAGGKPARGYRRRVQDVGDGAEVEAEAVVQDAGDPLFGGESVEDDLEGDAHGLGQHPGREP